MRLSITFALASLTCIASCHTIFVQFGVEGTTYPVSHGIRDPTYDGPIQDVTAQYIACNGGGQQATAPSSDIINVKAGDTVQATWRHTLTSTAATDSVYVVDPSHKGPTLAYLKKVTDATTATGPGSGWFKVQESGLNTATGKWATEDLIANKGVQNIVIPPCLEDGQYLLRPELIALHAAASKGGAQFYMECAQINVSGGTGTANPATATDPGILINIYDNPTSYTIPGPAPFTCGAGGDSTTPVVEPEVSAPPVSVAPPHSTFVTSAKPKASTVKAPLKSTGTGAHAPVHT
ncbi:glycoside hydrolase family 61 protein [Hyaloscypha variabilis F]|uniref:AA9 family lytic polysaccharide monooxygenase n=1 Tax=Hyaloscypha variabilis (strain UAMH 11265 / GT02V1 / F) TaxID=1149755 RepID=A0A2J6QZF9_HYAVF|nr:glycoside hydrolase family 61 protein [Hyaloscypha variabilis F]